MARIDSTRRQFLAGALAAPAAFAAGYRPSVAAASYVWTQDFHRRGVTLAEGVSGAFDDTRRAGYEAMELMSSFFEPEARRNTLEALNRNRLALPSVYHGGPMHEQAGADRTIAEILALVETVKPLGTAWINTNPSPKPGGHAKTDQELEVQARNIDRLGAAVAKAGLRLQLHHHNPEMANNAREWRHIARHTDPKLVSFCIDIDWVLRGAQVPMEILREAGPRLASLHLRNSRQGVWPEDFGDGDTDYRAVAGYLRQMRFAGILVVELAYEKGTSITRSLEEDLKISRQYTRQVFGV